MKEKIDKRVKYPLLKNLEIGQHFEVKCFAVDAEKYAKRLRSVAQMAKRRHNLIASYKVYKVIGAVILERTK